MCCSNNPMLHDEVKDLYIAAVKASPQDVDADVQVSFSVLQYVVFLSLTIQLN